MAILKSKQARPGHAAGIYSDMTLDGPEIGTLVAVVDRAKNLPNRKTMGKQDPYCAMRLAKEAKKTKTDRRGGQTPKWDQELRFTVHDSPDYYKLKCSVFNDDKKTELIGEAWIDLSGVIKFGGGQSDFWQQLNFKGKYAGDIRIELTFYDMREKPQEKRKTTDAPSQAMESGLDLSLPAQRALGPREIKRRPLPASPAGPPPPQPPLIEQQPPPQLPPKVPIIDHEQDFIEQPIHAPIPRRLRGASPAPDQNHYPQDPQDETYNDPAQYVQEQECEPQYSHISSRSSEQDREPWQYPLGQQYRDYQPDICHDQISAQEEQHWHDDMPSDLPTEPPYPDEHGSWQIQRPQPVHMHSEPVTSQHTPSAYHQTPAAAHSDSQLVRYQHQRDDNIASSTMRYTDSPLRQSVTYQDMQHQAPQADAPPPIPPKHRETTPRRPRSEYPPSAYVPQPLRLGAKRTSVAERSPLQSLEDDYLHGQGQGLAPKPHTLESQPQRHSMYVVLPGQSEQDRRGALGMQPYVSDPELPGQQPAFRSRRNSYEIRHPSFAQEMAADPQPIMQQHVENAMRDDTYQPFVEDAPPSPGLQPAVPRKAVGTPPKKLNSIPFGPDAYDVLNPASSPVTNENTIFQTPEQAKDARRLREVEKSRDLGPIIGNDGQEIDPSDHLPSDTWAPEPERKQRKPEHVIHIRSKNDRPSGARASPVVIRHHTNAASTQSSPAPIVTPQQISSHTAASTPRSFIGGRNRLQKPMPANLRPLPTQPYSSPALAAVSSPALTGSPQHIQPDGQRLLQQRRPSHDNRLPSHLTRPPLSEYQVPVGNSYAPRSDSLQTHGHRQQKGFNYMPNDTPTKPPPQAHNYSSPLPHHDRRQSFDRRNSYDNRGRRNSFDRRSDYSYENHIADERPPPPPQQYFDDPLAAEMSLIDIGPSRHSYQGSLGRSMVRRW